jgi:hypothetical protein
MCLYSGHKSDKHEFETGFYIGRHTMDNLLYFEPVNEGICEISVKLKYYNLTLLSTQAPTEEKDELVKEEFYGSLEKVRDAVHNYDMKTVLRDLDAKVGEASIYIQHVDGTQSSQRNK